MNDYAFRIAGAPAAPPPGLRWPTTVLLAACLAALIPVLALAPLPPGNSICIAALAAAGYPIARTGIAWQPHRVQHGAVAAALMLGLLPAFMTRALAPYLPGITLPVLATKIVTYSVLWGLYHAPPPA